MCSLARQAAVIGVLTLVAAILLGGLFVHFHSGDNAAETCYVGGSSLPEGKSLWPPGVRCSGGEPVFEVVRVNWAFEALAPMVIVALIVACTLAVRRVR